MELAVLMILILVNGFFALAEIALVSSKKTRLEQSKNAGSKGASIAIKLLDNSENFLSAIQVGITLIGIVTGVYGGMNLADDVSPYFQKIALTKAYADQIALTITVLTITYFSIVIGELVPKTIALSKPEKIAIRVAPVIYYFSGAFYPFVRLLSVSTNFINKIIGIKKHIEHITEAELRQMIKIASTEGVINKEQNSIHENVFYFADKKAKHIMTHRTDVEWVDINKKSWEIKDELYAARHSKVVCCNGGLDSFIGMLYVSDYFKAIVANNEPELEELIAEPLIVPENIDAQDVLKLLRQEKTHVCFVVNEYGGFEGIISLRDIIENIVGQIPDEGNPAYPDVCIQDDNSYIVNGDAPIETLTEIIENFTVEFDKIDYSTVAGFVFNQIDKIPQAGDEFVYNDYSFRIVSVEEKKIDKIQITRLI